jgi:hypothetical protein
MSDRVRRSRESGIDVLSDVVSDAVAALNRAVTGSTFRVLGHDGAGFYRTIVELIAARAVDALDEQELIAALWQGPDLLLLRWQPPGPARDRRAPDDQVRVVDSLRASFEAAVAYALLQHVDARLHAVLEEAGS